MGSKQCGKCGETVDEAKAFCPGCGHAFVEEEKRTVSEFDMQNETVRLGGTMYNQLLSDMGLSISRSPKKSDSKSEHIPIQPAAPPAIKPADPKPSYVKWIILGAVAALGVLLLLLLVLVILFWLLPRMAS